MSIATLFKNDSTTLVRDEHGEHFLIVLCGGVAMYECQLRLTSEELAFIQEFGEYYIQKLAADISAEPDKFKDRFVSP